MDLRLGEIVLIQLQFHQTRGAKIRPVVIVLDTGDEDVIAAPVTSRTRATEFDLMLADWQAAGLNVQSTVRVHKLAVLSKAGVRHMVGKLTQRDLVSFCAVLCRAFCPGSESVS